MRPEKNGFSMRLFGIIAFVAIIGLGVSACDDLTGDEDDSSSTTSYYGWYGKGSATNYTISTVAQLKELSDIVIGRSGKDIPPQDDFKGKTVTLTADIDMSGISWTGIGLSYIFGRYPFNGTFDGNNKAISNFNTTSNDGFFGLIGEYGIVKNLVFVDSGGSYGGGILARQNEGTVHNIRITNGIVSGGTGGGGVVYSNEGKGTVENCNFAGSTGGGGGIARQNLGVIRNCYVTGSITSGGISVGGIVGVNTGSGTVQNCYATGNVNGVNVSAGGIAGTNGGTIKNCYATGGVTGDKDIGGVVGNNGSSGIIQNCYSTGNVTGADPYVGGIAGSNGGTVQNCYATGNVTGKYYVGGIIGDSGTVQNCVALNRSLTATYISLLSDTWRIANRNGSLLNNYGLNTMTLPNGITVTSDVNGIHGADITSTEYNNANWWQNTAQFPSSAWEFRAGLPVLRDMPAGTQNPVVR